MDALLLLGFILNGVGGFCIGLSFAVEARSVNKRLTEYADETCNRIIGIQLELSVANELLAKSESDAQAVVKELNELKASINKSQEKALKELNKELKKSPKKKANIKKVSFSKKKEK